MQRVGAPTPQTLPVTFPTATLMKPVRQVLSRCTVEQENPGSARKSFASKWSHQDVQRRPSGKCSTCSQIRGKGKSGSSHVGQTGVWWGAPAGPRVLGQPRSQLREVFVHTVNDQTDPAPRVTSRGRFEGAWLLLYLPRESDTAEGGQGMCVLEGGGKGGRKKGEKEEGGGEASPLPASPVPLLTPTEWVAPGIPLGDCGQGGQGFWSPSPLSLAPGSQDPTCQVSV